MSIEQAIAEIEASGFFVSNLFQLAGGTWQSNLYDRQSHFEFGRGSTPVEALRDALAKANGEKRARVPAAPKPSAPAVEAVSGSVLD